MMPILALLGGAALIAGAYIHKRRSGKLGLFRAYCFAGVGVIIVGLFASGLLDSRAGFIVGIGLFAGWLAMGLVFAAQSRKQRDGEKRQ
jgi:hypothetical protein